MMRFTRFLSTLLASAACGMAAVWAAGPASFAPVTQAPLDTPVESGVLVVSGLQKAQQLTIKGGDYSLNGSAFASKPGKVVNGTVTRHADFVDSSNATQVLYPVFNDIAVLDQTVKVLDAAASATENGDGSATLNLSGSRVMLRPDYRLQPAPAARSDDLYWQEASRFYLNFPDGTVQSFTIQQADNPITRELTEI